MVIVAQLVRALDCGSKGRGFEPHLSPPLLIKIKKTTSFEVVFFILIFFLCFVSVNNSRT